MENDKGINKECEKSGEIPFLFMFFNALCIYVILASNSSMTKIKLVDTKKKNLIIYSN